MEYFLNIKECQLAYYRQEAEGAVKIHEDLERYKKIIAASKPDIIVECGTYHGGSALWFASLGIEVITIDIIGNRIQQAAFDHPNISVITGSSDNPDLRDYVAEYVSGKRVMVILDSDHMASHVRKEINLWADLVTPGCYLVIEDGIIRWITEFTWIDSGQPWKQGPLEPIEELLQANPLWTRDLETETMSDVTMHPAGWWIRNETDKP